MFSFDEYRRSRPFAVTAVLTTLTLATGIGCASWGDGPPMASPAEEFDDLVGRNVRFHMADKVIDMKVAAIDYPTVTGNYIDASYSVPPTFKETARVDLRSVERIEIHHSNVWRTSILVVVLVGGFFLALAEGARGIKL